MPIAPGGRGRKKLPLEARIPIRERLHHVMEYFGLTQDQLGAAIGAQPGTVPTWFQRYTVPDNTSLFNLAREFGISVDWLLTGDGAMIGDSDRAKGAAARQEHARKTAGEPAVTRRSNPQSAPSLRHKR